MTKATAAATVKHYDTILRPVVTEKSTLLGEHNKVTFKVHTDANKTGVKNAIEALFKVKVTKVNIINGEGKAKRFRGVRGNRPNYKKAIVTLAEGNSIDVTAGI